ncbi:GNAT family N-acetyltransferase [Fodinicola acaciae]|uniref:GNAT family N-acetyltransferase n=1 Tax=Fodinicola acaciae TaxID=2681555 RepID=UPI0013D4350E|nr:GNAT family N-acetyltransferase [Fodinicola acaciae]
MEDVRIETDGLILRAPTEADIPDIVGGCSDPSTQLWLPGLPSPYDEAAARDFVTRMAPELWQRGGRTWSVLDAATGRLLGNVGLPRWEAMNGVAEVGYWVAPWARRQRVASRAAAAAARYAFEQGAGRVELLTDCLNTASQRTAIAAGFTYEATQVSGGRRRDGSRGDMFVWRRLPDDPAGPSPRTFPDLPGGRLTDGVVALRTSVEDDLQVLVECFQDKETRRWETNERTRSVDFVRNRVRRTQADLLTGRQAQFTVVDVESGQPCGDCTVRLQSAVLGIAGLGYMIHPAYRGRGLATRAARLAADWALSLPAVSRVEVSAVVGNAASLRVIEKAGFRYEGVLRGYLPNPDGPRWDVGQSARVRD